MMQCRYCNAAVLWNWPVRGDGSDRTTCQECGAHNSSYYHCDEDPDKQEECEDENAEG